MERIYPVNLMVPGPRHESKEAQNVVDIIEQRNRDSEK